METSVLLTKFDELSKFKAITDDTYMWKSRIKDADVYSSEGSLVIGRYKYREEEWVRNKYEMVTKYRYFYCVVSDKQLYLKVVYKKSGETKLILFTDRYGQDDIDTIAWAVVDLSEKSYDKAVKIKDKADKEAEKKREAERRWEEEKREAERKAVEEEERKKQEIVAAEKARRSQPMVITVGMWEDLMADISELRDWVRTLDQEIPRYNGYDE